MNENKIVYEEGLQLVSRHFNLRQSKKQDSTWRGHFVNKNSPFYKVLYIAD